MYVCVGTHTQTALKAEGWKHLFSLSGLTVMDTRFAFLPPISPTFLHSYLFPGHLEFPGLALGCYVMTSKN